MFEKIVTIFPAKIKEVFLVYQYTSGASSTTFLPETHSLTSEAPMLGLGHFVDDYLLDFDIYHVSHVTELLLYIDTKYLSEELGKSGPGLDKILIFLVRWDQQTGLRHLDVRPVQPGQLQ